jgi:UDPglucose 6-dehydrogenase
MARSYSIIGLGKLGASMAAALASRGHRVVGVDTNPAVVQAVLSGRAPVEEPGLAEMLAAHGSRVTATMDAAAAVRDTDVTFVVVPTPSEPEGGFSIAYARAAMAAVGAGLRDKAGYHLVVMTSTVLPGATRHGLIPVLEEASGRRAGEDFGVCYSPEFIALGSVIRDFLNPDFTLVGELDPRSGATLEACYAEVLENGAPCRRMTLENAELAKIALNTFVTTKITFANMLADLCERLPGGDVDVVADALGLDGRIGRRYLTGATSYGGPCFPRDNQALSFLARALGTSAEMAETTDRLNRQEVERLLRRIGPVAGVRAAVLGLAYKPDTPVVEEAAGIEIARALAAAGARVRAWDPVAGAEAERALDGAAEVAGSLADCLAEAELVVVTTADPAFRGLGADDFAPGATIHDAWRILTHLADAPNVRYVAVGRGATELENQERLANLWSEPVETA